MTDATRNVVQVRRVVVSPSGETFSSPGAIARHEYQKSIGKARTHLRIEPLPTPRGQIDE